MHKILCRLGLRPRPHWGSLQRSPGPPSWIKGPTSKGRGEKGKGGKWREGIRGKGRGPTPKGMVGDLLLRERRGLLLRAPPHYRYWPPYSLNPGYGPVVGDLHVLFVHSFTVAFSNGLRSKQELNISPHFKSVFMAHSVY